MVGWSNANQLFRSDENFQILPALNEEQVNYWYASGKWNIKQITGHTTDHERIMTYRALSFSGKDTTRLSGYDQDFFAQNSRSNEMEVKDLLQDYKNVRQALSLMNSFSNEQLQLKGLAWKFELTVEDVLNATIGHEGHLYVSR